MLSVDDVKLAHSILSATNPTVEPVALGLCHSVEGVAGVGFVLLAGPELGSPAPSGSPAELTVGEGPLRLGRKFCGLTADYHLVERNQRPGCAHLIWPHFAV
jgi:hypothetical protein